MEENTLVSTWNTRKLKLMNDNNNNNNNNTEYQCKSPNEDKATEEGGHSDVESETRVEETVGNKRMKRHREEVKGKVKVPENWKQEQMLKEWVDYTTFDALFAPHRIIVNARDALIADVRKSQRLRIHT